MHGAADVSERQPKLSLGCPGSLQDAPWTFPGLSCSRPRALRTDPKQLFRAPEPFRSISGRCRMEWTLIVPNCPNTSFRRFVVEFSSYLHRSGNLLVRFSSDLVRCPARLSVRFSCFAGPLRYAGRSMFDDLLLFASICNTVSDNRVRIVLGPATGGEVLLPGASSPPFGRRPV